MRKIQPNPLIGGETENAYVSSAIQERTNRGTVFQNIVPLFSVLAQKKKQTIQISLTENENYGKLYIRKERKERSICVLHVWRGEMIW